MCNVRMLTFVAGALLVGFMRTNIVSGIQCDVNSMEPDFRVHGLCFSAYRDNQGPDSNIPVEQMVEQIKQRLPIIAPHTYWVRSFGASGGLEEIPVEARKLGLNVAMGVWIRHAEGRVEQITNLLEKAEADCVDIAVVGNEELLYHEWGKSDAIDPCELLSVLIQVREDLNNANLSGIPVTTAEPWNVLFSRKNDNSFKYQQILDQLDLFIVNIYPFHHKTSIDQALQDLREVYANVLQDANEAGPGKQVIIGETGWPSAGEQNSQAIPSAENAARYFYEASTWAYQNSVELFYFSAFDEKWKAPPELEAHWGIWDSNDNIKSSFLPDYNFCETFDPLVHPFCSNTYTEGSAPEPNLQGPDPNSDGQFLRLLYDATGRTHFSSAALDSITEGPFCRIVAEFDFRMYGPDLDNDADGFSFLLIPTAINGRTGCSTHGHDNFYAECPRLLKTFGVGFGVFQDDKICIGWDKKLYPDNTPIPNDIDLDSGDFHHVRIELVCSDSDTALVTLELTQNIYDPNHPPPVTIVRNLRVGDPDHPYAPYENRVELAGRNGGKDINADVDNIYVSYKFQVCNYDLPGDVNGDCKVTLLDFALLANNWLVNCHSSMPPDPACAAR